MQGGKGEPVSGIDLLFASGGKLSDPGGFIGGAMFWIDGIVSCG